MPIKVKRALKVAAVMLGFGAWFSLAYYSMQAFMVVSAIPILGVFAAMLWFAFEADEETEQGGWRGLPPRS